MCTFNYYLFLSFCPRIGVRELRTLMPKIHLSSMSLAVTSSFGNQEGEGIF
jgi:hypothetical protein